jgi:hypothetical protein
LNPQQYVKLVASRRGRRDAAGRFAGLCEAAKEATWHLLIQTAEPANMPALWCDHPRVIVTEILIVIENMVISSPSHHGAWPRSVTVNLRRSATGKCAINDG